jgi:hypothetical protein
MRPETLMEPLMNYYNDEKLIFLVDGQEKALTEEEAEALSDQGKSVVFITNVPEPLPDAAAEEYMDCTCLTPDSVCPSCELSLRKDGKIPWTF